MRWVWGDGLPLGSWAPFFLLPLLLRYIPGSRPEKERGVITSFYFAS